MNKPSTPEPACSIFWPVFLPGLALSIFLGWQLTVGVRQHMNGIRLEEQQAIMLEQATRAESQLRGAIMAVLEISRTNAQAAGIMKKFNVQYTGAPGEGLSPSPKAESVVSGGAPTGDGSGTGGDRAAPAR